MPFSPLYAFRESGVFIDPAIYSLHEVAELKQKHGTPAVELMIRLGGYGSALNPYDEDEKRIARALTDTNQANKNVQKKPLTADLCSSALFRAAAERFDTEKFDPAWEEFIVIRDKRIEIVQALRETPAHAKIMAPAAKPKATTAAQRKKQIEKYAAGDDTALDSVQDHEQMVEKTINNNKLIGEMTKTLKELNLRYDELEKKLFRHISSGGQQRAADFRSRLNH